MRKNNSSTINPPLKKTIMKILKADREAYVANISYLLSKIGTYENHLFGSPDCSVWKIQTKLGIMHFWTTPCSSDYLLSGEFKVEVLPTDDPIFHLLADQYYPSRSQFIFFRKEADLACLRSWEVAYESMAGKLCLLVHGHIIAANAIAEEGRLEDFLPKNGHVLMGKKKMTVAAFKKKYEAALGNQGRLFFDRSIELEPVPYSPFEGKTPTIIAK